METVSVQPTTSEPNEREAFELWHEEFYRREGYKFTATYQAKAAWQHQQKKIGAYIQENELLSKQKDKLEAIIDRLDSIIYTDNSAVIEALQAKLDVAIVALEKIDNGRDTHKIDKCIHGQYGYEQCESCLMEVATEALNKLRKES